MFNMYIYQKFCLNWNINMGDDLWQKVHFYQFFLFFSLNPSTSKSVRGTGLKFCTQVGSDDLMLSDLSKCL